MSAAKFLGEQRPELQHPSPDRFIRDIQAALGEQIFDIAEAEGEAKVQPHRVPDDVRRELVASKRDRCHSPSLVADPKPRKFPCQFRQASTARRRMPSSRSVRCRNYLGLQRHPLATCALLGGSKTTVTLLFPQSWTHEARL
jgi:hypothetical protein